MSIRIAVGVGEDESKLYPGHFGDSLIFLIFEMDPSGSYRLVERRPNTVRDMEEEGGHGSARKFRAVGALLKDVDVLVAASAGPNFPKAKERGHYPMLVGRRTVEDALKLVREELPRLLEELDEMRKRREVSLGGS